MFLQKVIAYIDTITETTGKIASWFTGILVLLISYDVLMRYVFNTSSAKITELEWHFFSLIFLLGAAYALKHDKHVRVDVFYTNFSTKAKAVINLLGTLIFLVPFSLIVLILSINFAYNSFNISETSPDPGGLPYLFLIKSAIPVGFILLFLQGISIILKSVVTLFSFDASEQS